MNKQEKKRGSNSTLQTPRKKPMVEITPNKITHLISELYQFIDEMTKMAFTNDTKSATYTAILHPKENTLVQFGRETAKAANALQRDYHHLSTDCFS